MNSSTQLGERRLTQRFPLSLDLKFDRLWPEDCKPDGTGRTIDISSKGLLFTSDTPLCVGSWLAVMVDWPSSAIDGAITLAARARVVRCAGGRVGAVLNWHEFRRHYPSPRPIET